MQEFEPITKDNIKEVLKYNKDKFNVFVNYEIKKDSFAIDFTPFVNKISQFNYIIQTNNFDEFLAFIQKRVKLEPLPKFDFEQYLLDNGFEKHNYGSSLIKHNLLVWVLTNHFQLNSRLEYLKTKENADILIAAAKLLEGLK